MSTPEPALSSAPHSSMLTLVVMNVLSARSWRRRRMAPDGRSDAVTSQPGIVSAQRSDFKDRTEARRTAIAKA
jgi:hypothetical protein